MIEAATVESQGGAGGRVNWQSSFAGADSSRVLGATVGVEE